MSLSIEPWIKVHWCRFLFLSRSLKRGSSPRMIITNLQAHLFLSSLLTASTHAHVLKNIENDESFSDDRDDSLTYPWRKRTPSWTFSAHHSFDLDRLSFIAKEKIIVVGYSQASSGKTWRLISPGLIDRNIWIGWQYSDYDVREHNQQAR